MEEKLYKVEKGKILKSKVEVDDFTAKITKCFDYEFEGVSEFASWKSIKPYLQKDFNIGLIVGSSGSGKSQLLKDFGDEEYIQWDNKLSIASNFTTPDEAIDKLSAVGLNSIPSWVKPYKVLSTGEAFRADLARRLKDNAVIDEFTSVVDRHVAQACSVAVSKYIRKQDIKGVVFATCHRDIIHWLNPDWVFDTDSGELLVGRCLCRPDIEIKVYKTTKDLWQETFAKYHYLRADMNSACRCFVATWQDEIVAFSGNLALPGRIPPLYDGDKRNKYRESRLVVIPDFQGMGIGTRFSNCIGEMFLNEGYRYFSKTAHIRMGEYRQKSSLWRPTSTNLKSRAKSRESSTKEKWAHLKLDTKRICYSHEYVGARGTKYRELWEQQKIKDMESKKK